MSQQVTQQEPLTHSEALGQMTGGMVMPVKEFGGSHRLRPDGRPRPEFRSELRRISNQANARNAAWVVALPLLVIAASIFLGDRIFTASWAADWAIGLRWASLVALMIAAITVMGSVHLRLFVLHHEAAHRVLFSKRWLNDLIGINFFGWVSFGTGTHAYRRAHTRHHRDEFGPDEPDFLLYSFYPIEPASLTRKLLRDGLGVSAWRINKGLITGIARPGRRLLSLRFYGAQITVATVFFLIGHPWLYLILWVLPYVSVYQIINRLRGIAEHGGMTRSPDRRITTHHVSQRWLTQRWLTPYQVGHHLAHHVDSGVPYRNLPKLTRALIEDGYITDEITWPNYRSLWRAMTAQAQ